MDQLVRLNLAPDPFTDPRRRPVAQIWAPGVPRYSRYNYQTFAAEGFSGNPYLNACISLIFNSCAGIPKVVYRPTKDTPKSIGPHYVKDRISGGGHQALGLPHAYTKVRRLEQIKAAAPGDIVEPVGEGHPFQRLLDYPTPVHDGAQWTEEFIAYLLIGGRTFALASGSDMPSTPAWSGQYDGVNNAGTQEYLRMLTVVGDGGKEAAVRAGEKLSSALRYLSRKAEAARREIKESQVPKFQPTELHPVRPDYVIVVPGATLSEIVEYQYRPLGALRAAYAPEYVVWLRQFNPLDPFDGLPTAAPAWRAANVNNGAWAWNQQLLDNGAVSSFLMISKTQLHEDERTTLLQRLKAWLTRDKRGSPFILEGKDIQVEKDLGFSPEKMQCDEIIKTSARAIAILGRVPPEMIGDAANKTHANFEQARQSLYTETVLPLMDKVCGELSRFGRPLFGEETRVGYDRDGVEALRENADAVSKRVCEQVDRNILDLDEARMALGYESDPSLKGVRVVKGIAAPLEAVLGAPPTPLPASVPKGDAAVRRFKKAGGGQ